MSSDRLTGSRRMNPQSTGNGNALLPASRSSSNTSQTLGGPPAKRQRSTVPGGDPPPIVSSDNLSHSADDAAGIRTGLAIAEQKPSPSHVLIGNTNSSLVVKPPVASDSPQPSGSNKTSNVSENTDGTKLSTANNDTIPPNPQSARDIVCAFLPKEEIPKKLPSPPALGGSDKVALELALQLDPKNEDDYWREDWSGNLAFLNKLISNPAARRRKPAKNEMTLTLWEWGRIMPANLRHARNLLAKVYHMRGTPPTAKRIISHAYHTEVNAPDTIAMAIRRTNFDPDVLQEDGWTVKKSAKPRGASGGPHHIGTRVIWQGFEAAVIAYIHDPDFGDLWKAMWLDEGETFDLEAEELQEATKKWQRKFQKPEKKKPERKKKETSTSAKQPEPQAQRTMSARFAAAANFTVDGIEHGIVMATTYNSNARQGVFWPARVMHVSELDPSQSQGKRNSAKQKITVVFLAPYWNSTNSLGSRSINFSLCPLLEMDSIEVSSETIQKYNFDPTKGLNLHALRNAFRFTGLPKSTFKRFLDSHRLALALKLFAMEKLKTASTNSHPASAALFDTHAMALKTAVYPQALLHLPLNFILSHMPSPSEEVEGAKSSLESVEPVVRLSNVLASMRPPKCWGLDPTNTKDTLVSGRGEGRVRSDPPAGHTLVPPGGVMAVTAPRKLSIHKEDLTISNVASDFLISTLRTLSETDLPPAGLYSQFSRLLRRVSKFMRQNVNPTSTESKQQLSMLLKESLRMKSFGAELLIATDQVDRKSAETVVSEWKKACEMVFTTTSNESSTPGFGNGVTMVFSDVRCNQHITSNGCVERPVRLPAAIKAAKQAGAGSGVEVQLDQFVDEKYYSLAEDMVLRLAHGVSYLKKMQAICSALSVETKGAPLTEDSEGEGGGDTCGSRGSYEAAVAGVAVALKAVNRIVGGACVNVFCATRPPGHHAGRSLHPMKAVSNGFCVLNPAACAALYAATDVVDGGLGLKRVCIIDFDVHHGNGTQDILCSTFDPRFLYVSMHAGGAEINGYETDESDTDIKVGGKKKIEGIFPGRCGDISPHKGVLNIPLGARVNPHDIGNALVNTVEPAVQDFSPDLIILSAGFDAHKNDPLGMGGLDAQHFGHITEVACGMAFRSCSGRILSILEGGYGVPCCRPQKDLFLPEGEKERDQQHREQGEEHQPEHQEHHQQHHQQQEQNQQQKQQNKRQQPLKLMDLEGELPEDMDDQVTAGMQRKLERCHQEGFLDCVREHVLAFRRNNSRS